MITYIHGLLFGFAHTENGSLQFEEQQFGQLQENATRFGRLIAGGHVTCPDRLQCGQQQPSAADGQQWQQHDGNINVIDWQCRSEWQQ